MYEKTLMEWVKGVTETERQCATVLTSFAAQWRLLGVNHHELLRVNSFATGDCMTAKMCRPHSPARCERVHYSEIVLAQHRNTDPMPEPSWIVTGSAAGLQLTQPPWTCILRTVAMMKSL